MPITSLDENTIRLITTTQVITSVYSAVKELVENALDANGENIEVNLVDNGTSLIEIKDDGDGIPKEDASFMALPSCTSKLTTFEDLGTIQTYGFRGEALHALCQIADVTVITKTEKDEVGTMYYMDNNGNIKSTELYPKLRGTTVQVKQMFKHFPVRRKIITSTKKSNQDVKSLEILLKSFGICNPMVRIYYRVNNNVVFIKPSLGSIKEAAEHILGRKIMSYMKWISHEETEVTMQLMIPNKGIEDINEICQTNHRYIFVNKRPIKYKDIEKAVNDVISEYLGPKLAPKKKPIFLVYILVDPMDIDINLEPNKDVILFKNQQHILDVITKNLINFYGLQIREEITKESDDTSNCYKDYTSTTLKENSPETELPVSKKRKISSTIDQEKTKETPNRKSIKSSCNNIANNINEKNNVSEDELQAITNYLNTTSTLHDSNRQDVDVKCVSHNEVTRNSIKNSNNRLSTNDSLLHDLNSTDETSNIQPNKNTLDNKIDDPSESISQLPVVDLGDDFELDLILNGKKSELNTSTKKTDDEHNNEDINLNVKDENSLEKWSKGHVNGLKGGTDVKPYTDFTNHALLSNDSSTMETTFTKFAKDARTEIMKEDPKMSAVQVARKITDMWKHLPSQEHGYYHDLAREERANKEADKAEMKKKLDAEANKNRKRLLRMLENMKNTNTKKSENLVMRTIVPWDMNIDKITKSFQNGCDYNHTDHVIGSININLWIIQNSAQLWILDISHILKGFNITDLTVDKMQSEDVERLFKQWISESKDMSMIYPIHTLK